MSNTNQNSDSKFLDKLPDVLDVQQMSDFLGISTKTGYQLLKAGTIRSFKIGRIYKVPKLYLIEYLNSCGGNE